MKCISKKSATFFLAVLLLLFWTSCYGRTADEYHIEYDEKLLAKTWQQTGVASWYGEKFHGRKTANGEIYDMYEFTAAHRTLPFNSILLIVNLRNGREVIVRVNDRGPFVRGRIIDLSHSAAREIGMLREGTARVRIYLLERGNKS